MTDTYGKILEYVLSGRAVLFVGSGPSAEMGYPSWSQQLDLLEKRVAELGKALPSEYDGYKQRNELPSAMESIERLIGRDEVLSVLAATLKPGESRDDSIYNTITKWPFSLYLTTNFDDEIISHLHQEGKKHFVKLCNSETDFGALVPDAEDCVFKIHGELRVDGNAVVTDRDYDELIAGENKKYYRKALDGILRTRPIIVIGYSLDDPDMRYLLTRANSEGSIARPICMLLCDVTNQRKEKFERQMRVRVIRYSADKTHSELKRILGVLNSFIQPNTSTAIHTEDSRHAAALYMFRMLQRGRRMCDAENHLLLLLPPPGEKMMLSQLANTANVPAENCRQSLMGLVDAGMVEGTEELGFSRSRHGDEEVAKCGSKFEITKRMAFDGFIQDFGTCLSAQETESFAVLAERAITELFNARGMTLVKSLFGRGEVSSGELFDIYNAVASVATGIVNSDKRLLFINGVRRFVLCPNSHQKAYLVALSQGYFLYHLMGQDAVVRNVNATFVSQSDWFVDSHILQSLIAEGCDSHVFTKSLFEILHRKHANLYVTAGVVDEVLYHFDKAKALSPENCGGKFYHTAMSLLHSKYNFFLDGFIQSSAQGNVGSFSQYAKKIGRELSCRLAAIKARYEIKEVGRENWNETLEKRFDIMLGEVDKIRRVKDREIPNRKKVETDAEIYVTMIGREDFYLARHDSRNVYFLSHSTVFDRVDRKLKRWTDYSLYRFLKASLNDDSSLVSLYDCLHSELIGAGLRIVDSENYTRYFSEEINAAKLEFENEREEYLAEVESESGMTEEELVQKFNAVPDMEKPLFVNAMQLQLAEKVRNRAELAEASQKKAEEQLSEALEENARLRHRVEEFEADAAKAKRRAMVEAGTIRNANDPKHVAKRLRQAKKRARKRRRH